MKAYQIQYDTPDGNKYVEWVKGTKEQLDEYIDIKCKRKRWTLDEVWSYEPDDPRVGTGGSGYIVTTKVERYRDYLEECGL